MSDSHVGPREPGQYGIRAGRDAWIAGRDLTVYVTYNGTWTNGAAAQPLMAESGGVEAPYRGLRPFGEQDEALFFGRERAVTGVLGLLSERLDSSGLLVVSGVSGAGKSSLLRAGVLPVLRREGLTSTPSARSWPCLVLSPGAGPLVDLADGIATMLRIPASKVRAELTADPVNFAALARQAALSGQQELYLDASQAGGADRPRLLIVVDQCEQLFIQCGQEDRHAFLTALYAASAGEPGRPSAMVVLVIRGDFEARLAEYRPGAFPELGQAVQDRYLLRAMNDRELRMAITGPAAKAGFKVAEDLVLALIGEMRASAERGGPDEAAIGAGALPLLSHALDQAWRARSGPDLGLADYERIGGIQHAIAVTAQAAYDDLNTAQQKAARSVFISLIATGSDGADTTVRLPAADLTAGLNPGRAADVQAVLDAFASRRLLTMGSGSVEISHESLLTAWPLLRDTWLADTHTDRIARTRLRNSTAEWERSRDPSYLYRGTLLQTAEEIADRIGTDPVRSVPLSRAEREFLRASSLARRRTTRWRQAAIGGLAVLTLAAVAIAGVAEHNAANANRQHAIALSRQLAAESLAQDQTDPDVAGRLATAAWRVSPTGQAEYAMLNLVAGQQDGTLPVSSAVAGVAFSPDGKLLATAAGDGMARLWDTATGQPVSKPLPADNTGATTTLGGVWSVAFSPDGRLLATSGNDGTARLWDTATGQPVGKPLRVGYGNNGAVWGVAFSPDGKLLATADQSGTARLWDPATGQPVGKPLPAGHGSNGAVLGVAFSPDGKLLATADQSGTARLWDPATGQAVGKPLPADTGTNGGVASVAFSPNGDLATADADGTARLWDPATGLPVGKPLPADTDAKKTTGFVSGVLGVAFSPNGELLATADADGTARLWNPATGLGNMPSLPVSTAANFGANDMAFSPNGEVLASADRNGAVQLWDPATGQPVDASLSASTRAIGAVDSVAFSPNGELLATADNDGTARLWDPATGQPVGKPLPAGGNSGNGGVLDLAFSPNGTLLATTAGDGTARLWDPATGQPVGKPLPAGTGADGVNSGANDMAFSPDGRLLATAGILGTVRLWDTATGQPVDASLSASTNPSSLSGGVTSVAFSPDGKLLATAGDDGTVRLWDTATGQPVGAPLPADSGSGVAGVAFSPDGELLATAGDDGSVGLWDTATGQPVGKPFPAGAGAIGEVNGVAFSPDGKLLATADNDGITQLWGLPLFTDPYQVLCTDFGPPTQSEWAQYAQGEPLPKVCS